MFHSSFTAANETAYSLTYATTPFFNFYIDTFLVCDPVNTTSSNAKCQRYKMSTFILRMFQKIMVQLNNKTYNV